MPQYRVGTVNVTNGSAIVIGTNTTWLTNAGAGNGFTIQNSGVSYTVASVQSDTQITLSSNYGGTTGSGLSYVLFSSFTYPDNIAEIAKNDIETATIITRSFRKIQDLVSNIANGTYTSTNVFPNIDITGGLVDGAPVGSRNASTGSFTSLAASTVDLNGGNIDNVVIGNTTPAPASFTEGNFTSISLNGNSISNWAEPGVGVVGTLSQVLASGNEAAQTMKVDGISTVFSIKTSAYTAVNRDSLFCNTTSAPFTIILPAAPLKDWNIVIADYAGKFDVNNLTIARNGRKIMGLEEDLVLDVKNISLTLKYIDETQGWRVV